MNLISQAKAHLKSNNMSYVQHLLFALYHGVLCLISGIMLIIHGLMPCFFQTSGSDLADLLNKTFAKRKQ